MRYKCVCAFLICLPLLSQSYTGSIGGRVSDSSGLAIPKAQVTITEESTNTVFKTLTNDSGDFVVSFLKPGSYQADFSAPGFKKHVESGVQLQINQQRRIDVAMEIGQVTEKVEVSAMAAQIDYVSPEIGQVVDADQLVNLPELSTNSRGRSPFLLAKLLRESQPTAILTPISTASVSPAGARRPTKSWWTGCPPPIPPTRPIH